MSMFRQTNFTRRGPSRRCLKWSLQYELECGPMPVMAALLNIGGVLSSTPQSLADAQYWSAVQ